MEIPNHMVTRLAAATCSPGVMTISLVSEPSLSAPSFLGSFASLLKAREARFWLVEATTCFEREEEENRGVAVVRRGAELATTRVEFVFRVVDRTRRDKNLLLAVCRAGD
jgi:hypothetical protein